MGIDFIIIIDYKEGIIKSNKEEVILYNAEKGDNIVRSYWYRKNWPILLCLYIYKMPK